MAQALTASMPQFAQLGYNTTVVLEAIDPSTGAAVSGVTVSNVDIWAEVDTSDTGGGGFTVGPYMLIPGPNA